MDYKSTEVKTKFDIKLDESSKKINKPRTKLIHIQMRANNYEKRKRIFS
jgi:cystathionine beta-lyase family protein involved in aluminum resistance